MIPGKIVRSVRALMRSYLPRPKDVQMPGVASRLQSQHLRLVQKTIVIQSVSDAIRGHHVPDLLGI